MFIHLPPSFFRSFSLFHFFRSFYISFPSYSVFPLTFPSPLPLLPPPPPQPCPLLRLIRRSHQNVSSGTFRRCFSPSCRSLTEGPQGNGSQQSLQQAALVLKDGRLCFLLTAFPMFLCCKFLLRYICLVLSCCCCCCCFCSTTSSSSSSSSSSFLPLLLLLLLLLFLFLFLLFIFFFYVFFFFFFFFFFLNKQILPASLLLSFYLLFCPSLVLS